MYYLPQPVEFHLQHHNPMMMIIMMVRKVVEFWLVVALLSSTWVGATPATEKEQSVESPSNLRNRDAVHDRRHSHRNVQQASPTQSPLRRPPGYKYMFLEDTQFPAYSPYLSSWGITNITSSSPSFNIRAVPLTPYDLTKSVQFVYRSLTTNATSVHTENIAPYAFCGNTGNYFPKCEVLGYGTHSVAVTSYTQRGAKGIAGYTITYIFSIVPPVEGRETDITNFINSVTLSGQRMSLKREFTAEEKALAWLIRKDPLVLNTTTPAQKFRLQQRFALLTFWFQQVPGNREWEKKTNWLTTLDECEWYQVECKEVNLGGELSVQKAVVRFHAASFNNYYGYIPADVGLLTSLESLGMADNKCYEGIPSSIGRLTKLKALDLAPGLLLGTIPSEIGLLTNLENVDLYGNNFSGSLPSSIGELTQLTWFSVNDNNLMGRIPDSIANWSNLFQARFENNQLTGSIPSSLCLVSTLDLLWVDCPSEVTCQCCTCS